MFTPLHTCEPINAFCQDASFFLYIICTPKPAVKVVVTGQGLPTLRSPALAPSQQPWPPDSGSSARAWLGHSPGLCRRCGTSPSLPSSQAALPAWQRLAVTQPWPYLLARGGGSPAAHSRRRSTAPAMARPHLLLPMQSGGSAPQLGYDAHPHTALAAHDWPAESCPWQGGGLEFFLGQRRGTKSPHL